MHVSSPAQIIVIIGDVRTVNTSRRPCLVFISVSYCWDVYFALWYIVVVSAPAYERHSLSDYWDPCCLLLRPCSGCTLSSYIANITKTFNKVLSFFIIMIDPIIYHDTYFTGSCGVILIETNLIYWYSGKKVIKIFIFDTLHKLTNSCTIKFEQQINFSFKENCLLWSVSPGRGDRSK